LVKIFFPSQFNNHVRFPYSTQTMNPTSSQKQIIIDGDCPVCVALKDFTEEKTEDQKLEFIPYQSDIFEQKISNINREDAQKTLFVVTEKGKQLRGARAVFEIMSELPGGWGFIGKILKLPPFYLVADPFYRQFAKHRHGVSKFLRD